MFFSLFAAPGSGFREGAAAILKVNANKRVREVSWIACATLMKLL